MTHFYERSFPRAPISKRVGLAFLLGRWGSPMGDSLMGDSPMVDSPMGNSPMGGPILFPAGPILSFWPCPILLFSAWAQVFPGSDSQFLRSFGGNICSPFGQNMGSCTAHPQLRNFAAHLSGGV